MIGFDEQNRLQKPYKDRSIPYNEYFGDMDLSDEQKKERISFAEDTEEVLLFVIALFSIMRDFDAVDETYIGEALKTQFTGVVASYTDIDEYLDTYIQNFTSEFVSTTLENLDSEWYLSDDRAMFDSENESNGVLNYKDYMIAIASGKKNKTWITFGDSRVRKTHKAVDGKAIPIKSLFSVGKTFMRFPKDTEYAKTHPEELINCRCSVKYS